MPKLTNLVVVLLLLLVLVQSIASIGHKSVTNDEISHITSGYSYIKTGIYFVNKEHPPLVRVLGALPLLLLDPLLPSIDVYVDQWDYSQKFFFEYNDNADQMLFYARIPIILLSLLLGLYVFIWAKEMFGVRAALLSLFIYSFSPNILAHSRLVTTDFGATAFIFIATYYFWRFLNKKTNANLLIAGISFGLALASKMTALYLIPIYVAWAFFSLYHKGFIGNIFTDKETQKKAVLLLSLILIIFFIGFFVVISAYGFRLSEYKSTFDVVARHSTKGHTAFLNGNHSTEGWWYYFIEAFILKTPLPTILLFFTAILLFGKIRHKNILNEYFLIFPIAIFFAMFMVNKISIGLRHILPIYPFLFVFCGRAGNLGKKMIYFFVFVLMIWYMFSSIAIFPNYLAYFNEIVGPDNGHNYLIDSNIDWGQDLKGLKQYMVKNNLDNITLAYFGKDSTDYRKIEYDELQCYPTNGIIAISVNLLQGFTEEQAACTKWLKGHKPVTKIGYSIFVYDISGIDENNEQDKFCREGCIKKCGEVNLRYSNSFYDNGSCECDCK